MHTIPFRSEGVTRHVEPALFIEASNVLRDIPRYEGTNEEDLHT